MIRVNREGRKCRAGEKEPEDCREVTKAFRLINPFPWNYTKKRIEGKID
jgi:hypothetical protein